MAKTPKPPRPPIVPEHPKPEVAERVKNFAAVGMKQEQIARLERMDPKTLRKYYHDFWEDGYYQANANIGKSGYQLAVGRPAEYDDKGRLVREELKPDKSAADIAYLPPERAIRGRRTATKLDSSREASAAG